MRKVDGDRVKIDSLRYGKNVKIQINHNFNN